MSTRQDGPKSPPISSRNELVAWLEAGCKPRSAWRIGTEHEKLPFYTGDCTPVPYAGPRGIRALLEGLGRRYGLEEVIEGGNVIALRIPEEKGGGSVSLEPGGQFELSGATLRTAGETRSELEAHFDQVRAVGRDLGIGFLPVGFSPLWSRAETPGMPKGRYKIMTAYMPKVGRLGLDMMYRSCTVQVNLDFASEADMVKKFRVSLALQPVVAALCANSPFTEGRPNGFLSFRSEVWRDTDPDRTGLLPFVFEEGFGFERYVDYLLDVPMYFVFRNGGYVDVSGKSFRDFLEGRLASLPGDRPDIGDWADHVSTAFPEVRMKRFLEMRGADAGNLDRLVAVPALWAGLLYDAAALDAAWALVRDWTAAERQQMRDSIPRTALKTPFRRRTVGDIARDVIAIARQGLERRGCGEVRHLESLEAVAASGVTEAERLLDLYNGPWNRDVRRAFATLAI